MRVFSPEPGIVISIHAPARGATAPAAEAAPAKHNFNPRSREGSDKCGGLMAASTPLFQSTLPRGERPCRYRRSAVHAGFQSTLPRGERHLTAQEFDTVMAISIHAPARGATAITVSNSCAVRYFNPRSREGSDSFLFPAVQGCTISIHAPARGATLICAIVARFTLISIHAPARGATITDAAQAERVGYFNPRSREGSDNLHHPAMPAHKIFQSTLPRGERPRETTYIVCI